MFRRDPLTQALQQASELLEIPSAPLLPLARPLLRRGGVLGVAGQEPLVLGLGAEPGGRFELASVTKPFTAALADALVRSGQLAWNTPLHTLGGPLRRLPRWFTPLRLATHTAGLPPHPARAAITSLTQFHDPYGTLSPTDALASARRWAAEQRPPRFLYSNLGVGVLGLALAYTAGEDLSARGYDRALHRWVTEPLGLGSVSLQGEGVVRPAGWLGSGEVTQFGALAAAGGLFGTADDLLSFAAAHLSGAAGKHWQLAATPPGLRPPAQAVSPGWFVAGPPASPVLWHEGVARGTRSALGFNPVTGKRAVLLLRGGLPLVATTSPGRLLLHLLGAEA